MKGKKQVANKKVLPSLKTSVIDEHGDPVAFQFLRKFQTTKEIENVIEYHEQSKHHFEKFAEGPPKMDWSNQPNPFRFFRKCETFKLPIPENKIKEEEGPTNCLYPELYSSKKSFPSQSLSLKSLSSLFYYSLSISSWKKFHDETWTLRVNPRFFINFYHLFDF